MRVQMIKRGTIMKEWEFQRVEAYLGEKEHSQLENAIHFLIDACKHEIIAIAGKPEEYDWAVILDSKTDHYNEETDREDSCEPGTGVVPQHS